MNRWTLAAAACLVSCSRESEIDRQPIEPEAEAFERAPGVAQPPFYVGVWAVHPSVCAFAPGSADPSPIALTEREFLGYESRCRVAEAQEGTEGGWRLSLVCASDGIERVETLELDVDGAMLRVRRQDGPEAALVRCEEE
jgi:hypothetical protein